METLDQLAIRQYGHLSQAQLRAVLTRHTVRRRRLRGLYVPVYRHVMRLANHQDSEFGRYAAALLALGAPAALDGRAAARAHGITAVQRSAAVDIVVPYGRAPRPIAGIKIRRTRVWDRLGVTDANRLAVPSLAMTAVRLAPQLTVTTLTDVLQDMIRLGLDPGDLASLATGRFGRHAELDSALAALSISAKSALERLVFPALDAAGIGTFHRNVVVRDNNGDVIEEVDALFDDARVAVQLDGWAFHHDRHRFGRDRANQNRLAIEAGLLVLRFTHGDVTKRLPDVVEQVRQAVTAQGRVAS
jgi:hypothetical protein